MASTYDRRTTENPEATMVHANQCPGAIDVLLNNPGDPQVLVDTRPAAGGSTKSPPEMFDIDAHRAFMRSLG